MSEVKNTPDMRFKGYSGDWKEKSWAETVDISTNMVDPRAEQYDELLHIGPGNIESFTGRIYNNVLNVKDSNLISGKFHFNKGDIIYGKINPQLAKYTIAPFEGLASADAYVLNSKNGLVQSFLYMVLQTREFYNYSVSVSSRTGMPKINRDELDSYNFIAPQSTEQIQIGTFFKNLDNQITLKQRKLHKLVTLKKAMLEKMFPKEGADEPEIRFKGFSGAWEEFPFDEKVDFYSGLTYSPNDIVGSEGTLVLRSSNIQHDEIVLNDTVYVDSDVVNCDNVQQGDIIIVVRNGSRALIGKNGLVKKPMKNTVIGAFMTGIRAKQYEFIKALLDTNHFKKQVDKNLGATINQITNGAFKSMAFMFPIEEEQKVIGTYFAKLDDLISLQKIELTKLKQIKSSCLEKMFV